VGNYLGVITKGTIIEVNISELGLVTSGGKVVWGKYAQVSHPPTPPPPPPCPQTGGRVRPVPRPKVSLGRAGRFP
jgi:hypothetical protein